MTRRTLTDEPRLGNPSFFSNWRPAIVRHSDLDPNGHVTNSVYAAWFDDGRYDVLKRFVLPLFGPGSMPALVSVTIDYACEIGFGDEPRIGTALLDLGRSSLAMGQGLFVGDACAATSSSVTVIMDRTTRRSQPLDDRQRIALTAMGGRR